MAAYDSRTRMVTINLTSSSHLPTGDGDGFGIGKFQLPDEDQDNGTAAGAGDILELCLDELKDLRLTQ